MTTMKFCSIAYQHADWLSKNRLADPVTGCDSDGYLLSALTGGFHANFDSSVIEAPVSDTAIFEDVVTTIGDMLVCDSTANDTVTRLPAGTNNQILKGATGAVPAWTTVDYSGTTGTGGTVGQIAIADMTATGAVIVTALEDLGVGYVISHVVCGVGLITVYQRDVLDAGLGAATAVDTKKVAVHVIKLS